MMPTVTSSVAAYPLVSGATIANLLDGERWRPCARMLP